MVTRAPITRDTTAMDESVAHGSNAWSEWSVGIAAGVAVAVAAAVAAAAAEGQGAAVS